MKKTFITVLRTMCVGAMALFAVSCYDDSALTEGLAGLKDRVDGIEARLDSLEKALNADVKTINTTLGTLAAADEKLAADIAAVVADVKKVNETLVTLDAADGTLDGKISDLEKALGQFKTEAEKQLAEVLAKIAVVDVKKNDAGNYVLTFATGETLVVAAADANANNTGLITTVEVEGVTYWAIVQADGTTKVLEAVVHPDTKLAFKVDPETNELLVSYDGTWEQTGVIVNDDTTINVVEDFVYTEGDEYVTVTVGGKEYQLPLYEADNSVLELSRADFYVMYGGSKTVEITVEGAEFYVMSKPDGWKVNLDETVLTVTAPKKSVIEMGAADSEGQILVHATTAEGKCKVAKLDVKTGEPFAFTYANGNFHVFNAYLYEQSNMWGDVMVNFADMYVGIMTVDEFRAEPSFESMLKDIMADPEQERVLGNLITITSNQTEIQTWYQDGVCEVLDYEISLEDLAAGSWPPYELDEDETYVVWMLPQDSKGYMYDYAMYAVTGNVMAYEAVDSTYNNAVLAVDFFGADGYYVGATNKTYIEEFLGDWGFESEFELFAYYLENGTMGGWGPPSGPFSKFLGGNPEAMGKFFQAGSHTINMKDVLLADAENTPDNEYYVWALPYYSHKPFAEYTLEDLYVYTCNTKPLAYNENLAPTVTIDKVAFDTAVITIVPPVGGTTKYELLTAEDFAEFVDSELGYIDTEAIIKYLEWNWALDEKDTVDYSWMVGPATEYVLMTYNVANGEHSVTYYEFATPEDPASALPSPDKKQWVTSDEAFLEVFEASVMLDFGVSSKWYADYGIASNTMFLALSYEDLYGADAAGIWVSPMFFGSYTITNEDETSGVILYNGVEIPYSNLTETTCTFDFTNLGMGIGEAEFTLVEEEVMVQAQ